MRVALYPSSVTLREGNLPKPYQSINTSYPIRKTWWLYLLLEKNLAIASYTKALFVQKWQMFSESDRRGIRGTGTPLQQASFRFSERGFWLNNCPGTELFSRGATPRVSSPQQRFTLRVRDGVGVGPSRQWHQERKLKIYF